MRKSEIALWAFLLFAGITVGLTYANVSRSNEAAAANPQIYRQLDLFGDVLEQVRAQYVEEPDDAKLIESAINGMLSGLDPHSAYLPPKNFDDVRTQTRGEFGGIGIQVTMEKASSKSFRQCSKRRLRGPACCRTI